MKIVITTLIWKRPEVFKIWAVAVQRIISEFPDIDFEVLIAGSEGRVSKKITDAWKWHYIETPNQPLGLKANIRLKACKKLKPDYVLFLGSDDIMSIKTFAFILKKIKKGFDEIAPMDLYIYDAPSKTLVYSQGYINHRKGERLAIGRAIHKDVLDRIGWTMWDSTRDRNLDGSSKGLLNSVVKNPYYYWLKKNNLMIVDIKTEINLSVFQIRNNHTIIDTKKLGEHFPEIKKQLVSL